MSYEKGTLSGERFDKLDELDSIIATLRGMSNKRAQQTWKTRFDELKEFISEHGRYPRRYVDNKEEKKLGGWVSTQRTAYKNGTLKKDREDSLNEIGFKWYEHVVEDWEESRDKLSLFISEHGRYPSLRSENEEEKKLGTWVSTQRAAYKNGTLKKNREDSLNEIGFKWVALEGEWEESRDKLSLFISEHGRYPSTEAKDEEEKKLGKWVSNQRQAIKKGKMPLVRYKLLRRQKFVFDTKEEKTLSKANEEFFNKANKDWSR